MNLRGEGGHDNRQGSKADGAQPVNSYLGSRAVERVGQCRTEDKGGADQDRMQVLRYLQIVGERQADARVGQQQRRNLAFLQTLTQKQHANQHGHGWVDKQNQPLQRRRDVLQANKIKNAGPVVTEQPQGNQHAPVFARERRRCATQPQRGPQRDRQGKTHAQRQQGDRIHGRSGIGQLDEDRLERETEGGEHRECNAQSFSRPGFPWHVGNP